MKFLFVLAAVISMAFFSAPSLAKEVNELSYGTAVDENGKVVYREKHTSRFLDGKLQTLKTEYLSEEGKSFGSIASNFKKSTFVPNYKFEDSRHDRFAGIKWQGDKVIAFAKEKAESVLEQKTFVVGKSTVSGQGLHNFIREHVGEFAANQKHVRAIKFLVPMNQDTYTFRVRTKVVDKKKGTVKIRIEADSWLFRLVAPHIDVTYDIKSRRLLEYKGPSNLLSNDKKKMKVTIAYKYPEGGER